VTHRRFLRIKDVHLPGSIVVQNKFGAGHVLLCALGSFRESFIRAAIIIDDDAGPRVGNWVAGLASHGKTGDEKEGHRYDQGEIRHFVILPSKNFSFQLLRVLEAYANSPFESIRTLRGVG
jgi:hypothetical protein